MLIKVFDFHKRYYGTRWLRVALRHKGHRVGRQRQRTAMRRQGLRALQPKAYTPRTTDSAHGLRCAPNRLLDQPKPTQANRVWCSDSTYRPLADGTWAYSCAFQDVANKQVQGLVPPGRHCAHGGHDARRIGYYGLAMGFLGPPTPELIVHSDRGGQYGGNAYRALLHPHGAVRSQSRRGDYYDNAQAESLWSRFKTEEPERWKGAVFTDLADAQASAASYFD